MGRCLELALGMHFTEGEKIVMEHGPMKIFLCIILTYHAAYRSLTVYPRNTSCRNLTVWMVHVNSRFIPMRPMSKVTQSAHHGSDANNY